MSTVSESDESITVESHESTTSPTPAEVTARAALDHKNARLEYWTKLLGAITAALVVLSTALGIGFALLKDKSEGQSEDIDSLKGTIDSLQRNNADLKNQARTLEEEAEEVRAQRDDALRERDDAREELQVANERLAEAGVGGTSTSPTSPAEAGGEVRIFTVPWSNGYGGTAVDLDAGAVRDSGVDLRYKNEEGRRAVVGEYGRTISTNIGIRNPGRTQCRDAIDRRPLAKDDFWASPATNEQACVLSDFGISLLTVQGTAENGDLTLTQTYWQSD